LLAIIKDTSIYAVGDILTKGIGFFAIIFYTHFISQTEMGAYGYILVIMGFANTFLVLGADNAYARYFFECKTEEDRQLLTTTLFTFLSIWVVLVLIIPIIYSDTISLKLFENNDYGMALFLALLSLPLKLLSTMSNQVLRNQFQTKKFISYNFFTALITIVSAILLLNFTNFGIGSIFLGMIIADSIIMPFRIYAIKNLFVKKVDFSIMKKILAYGIPFLPASIAYWVFSSADRIMLESMSSLESVGIYTVAVTLAAVMSIFASAVGQAWSPHAVKVYEENPEKARKLYGRFLNVLTGVALFIVFSAAMLGKEVITYIFPSEYNSIFYPMLFLLIGIGFKITTQVTAIGIGLKKKTIYMLYITIVVALVNIGLNYLLIPSYDEVGASVATMISFVLLTSMYAFVTQKLFRIEYDNDFMLKTIFLLIAIVGLSSLDIIVRISILVAIFIVMFKKRDMILEVIR